VCTSGEETDLALTDKVAGDICERLAASAAEENKQQYEDNLLWIRQAQQNKLVVGIPLFLRRADEISSSFN